MAIGYGLLSLTSFERKTKPRCSRLRLHDCAVIRTEFEAGFAIVSLSKGLLRRAESKADKTGISIVSLSGVEGYAEFLAALIIPNMHRITNLR